MKRIAIRADASARLGWGHLKRCLALAHALRAEGADVHVLSRPSDVDVTTMVQAAGFVGHALALPPLGPEPVSVTVDEDAHASLHRLQALQADAVVVDHYGLDATWHRAVRTATGARLAAIDDLADRPLAVDLLIDHNPSPDHRRKYAGWLSDGTVLCVGPAHALLDRAYASADPAPWQDEVTSIGVFMGATDPHDHSSWVLDVCRHGLGWTGPLQVATTRANRQLGPLLSRRQRDPGLSVLVDQPDLVAFHRAHGLQIGAGGGALWERCALGVPTVALVCAENQRAAVPLLAEAGVVLGLDAIGRTPAQAVALAEQLRSVLAAPAQRRAWRERSLALVDGQGAARVAAALLALLPADTLRLAAP